MLEIIMAIAVVIAMYKMAEMENQSTAVWIAASIVILLGCFMLPLPFIRVLIAGILSYAAMFDYKVAFNK